MAVLLVGCVAPVTRGVVAPKQSDDVPRYHGIVQERPYVLPAMTLTDRSGQPFNVRTSPSRPVTLITFGYAACAYGCADTLIDLAETIRTLPADIRDDLTVVVIDLADSTTKGERRQFHAWLKRTDPHFLGLTGPGEQVHQLARDLGVEVHHDAHGALLHGDQILGFDRKRAGVLVWTADMSVEHLAQDLQLLVACQR